MIRHPVIETQRLSLFEFIPTDAPFIFQLLNTPKWISFIGDRGVRTLEDAVKYIDDRIIVSYRKFGFGLYLVRLKDGATPLGMCGLVRREHLNDVDLGFAFLPDFEKNGFALEASAAVLDFARDGLRLKRVVAITMKENDRSINLLKKLGLQFEKVIQSPGENDLMLYGMEMVDG